MRSPRVQTFWWHSSNRDVRPSEFQPYVNTDFNPISKRGRGGGRGGISLPSYFKINIILVNIASQNYINGCSDFKNWAPSFKTFWSWAKIKFFKTDVFPINFNAIYSGKEMCGIQQMRTFAYKFLRIFEKSRVFSKIVKNLYLSIWKMVFSNCIGPSQPKKDS